MKAVYYFTIPFIIWYIVTIHMVDRKCREHEGWEYLSVFPVPMCHAELNTSTLQYLESIIDKKEINIYSL